MDNPVIVSVVTLLAVMVVVVLLLLVWSGGDVGKVRLACRCFGRALRDRGFADKVQGLLAPPTETISPKPSGIPLRMLALLQREGRLLDFLLEDIAPYSDDQVGAAVRETQRQCRKFLKEHLVLEPVLPQTEGELVEVAAGFDPSAIRLAGNVTGQPPFKGMLKHAGWRVTDIKLQPLPEGQDELVLAPAEVELP